jgi:hypothetical protein
MEDSVLSRSWLFYSALVMALFVCAPSPGAMQGMPPPQAIAVRICDGSGVKLQYLIAVDHGRKPAGGRPTH